MINLLVINCYIFLIISSTLLIYTRNMIYSVLSLVSGFIATSLIFFVFECEFLALIFIIVYVGAIAVLFLFSVMVLDIKLKNFSRDPSKYYPLGGFISFIIFYDIMLATTYNPRFDKTISSIKPVSGNWYSTIDINIGLKTFGQLIYTHYIVQFLVAGLILFLVLIGVAVLTISFNQKQKSYQNIAKQLSRVVV